MRHLASRRKGMIVRKGLVGEHGVRAREKQQRQRRERRGRQRRSSSRGGEERGEGVATGRERRDKEGVREAARAAYLVEASALVVATKQQQRRASDVDTMFHEGAVAYALVERERGSESEGERAGAGAGADDDAAARQ